MVQAVHGGDAQACGGEVYQDKAVTLDVVYRLLEGLEANFKNSKDREGVELGGAE